MLDDLQNLRKLASNLTEEFKLVSEDFLIGNTILLCLYKSLIFITFLPILQIIKSFKSKVTVLVWE